MIDIFNSPMFVACFTGGIAISIALWSNRNKSSDRIWDEINKKANTKEIYAVMSKKVDKEDHQATMKRMGKVIDKQDDELDKIGKAVSWIVGKMNGDYRQITGGT